jgi:hypothetical protein
LRCAAGSGHPRGVRPAEHLERVAIVALNNTYGSPWRQPQTILVGRMIKLGMQVDF